MTCIEIKLIHIIQIIRSGEPGPIETLLSPWLGRYSMVEARLNSIRDKPWVNNSCREHCKDQERPNVYMKTSVL